MASLFAAGCYPANDIRAQNEVLAHDLQQARHDGAYRCAPHQLAAAEANLEFSNVELGDGHPTQAHDFSALAQTNVKQALEMSQGCGPKEVVIQEVKDSDGDGVPDDLDRCPTVPGPKENFGCPWGDRDHDGITDNLDKCPDVPGIPELQGCPDVDTDGDGIVDRLDRCPTVKGVPPDGCPPPKVYSLVVVRKDRIEIKQQVHFATNKSQILPDSFELLGQVAQVLIDNPSMKVKVEGHTDTVGGLEHNMKLSQDRADSVMAYLIEHSIEAARLQAEGFGPNRPIASNATKAGKAQNRRVEFKIVGQDSAPAEAPVPAPNATPVPGQPAQPPVAPLTSPPSAATPLPPATPAQTPPPAQP